MKDKTLCKARNCNNIKGGPETKCGDLCHDCWSKKSSSSYSKITDDPSKKGTGPNFDDPSLEEIEEMKDLIKKQNDEKLRPSNEVFRPKTTYTYHGEPLDDCVQDWLSGD